MLLLYKNLPLDRKNEGSNISTMLTIIIPSELIALVFFSVAFVIGFTGLVITACLIELKRIRKYFKQYTQI